MQMIKNLLKWRLCCVIIKNHTYKNPFNENGENKMKAIVNGKIILKDRVLDGCALLYTDVIEGILPKDKIPADAEIIDAKGGYVAPGLIDLHIHGYLGKDVCDGEEESIRTIAGGIVKNGVTGFLPTTMTVDMKVIRRALEVCRALKEEGLEVVLINSNPATIMTDKNIADKVYIEPLTPEIVKKIVIKEQPDSVLPSLGGQTGLNLAMELAEQGFWREQGVKLLGTNVDAIKMAEDRQEFKDTMERIGEPCIASKVVTNIDDAISFADEIGLPVIVRPAYTLGGTGGGIAYTREELHEIGINGLRLSRVHQVLIEK